MVSPELTLPSDLQACLVAHYSLERTLQSYWDGLELKTFNQLHVFNHFRIPHSFLNVPIPVQALRHIQDLARNGHDYLCQSSSHHGTLQNVHSSYILVLGHRLSEAHQR